MPSVNRRTLVITLIVAALLGLGAVALIGRLTDAGELLDAVREADPAWLPLCIAGELIAYAGYVLAYQCLAGAEGGPRLPLPVVLRVVMIGFGATFVGSSAGGLAVNFWALHRAGAGVDDAARRVLAFNTLEWAALALAASAAGCLALAGAADEVPTGMALAWPVVTAACVAAAWWISSGSRGTRLAVLPPRGPRATRRPRTWWPWTRRLARRGLADVVGALRLMGRILTRPRHNLVGLVGFPLYWAGNLLCLDAALRAFGAHIGLTALVLAYTTAYVATALPLPAGGSGGIEAALALTLSAVGVPIAQALLATLVFRAVTFWLPIIPAMVALGGVRGLDEDLAGVVPASA